MRPLCSLVLAVIVDRKKGKVKLHFPKGWSDGWSEVILEGTYDPITDKIDIFDRGERKMSAYFGLKPDGMHTVTFDKVNYRTMGPAH